MAYEFRFGAPCFVAAMATKRVLLRPVKERGKYRDYLHLPHSSPEKYC